MLTRAEIDSAIDCQRVALAVPEWGGSVWLYPLSLADRFAYYRYMQTAGILGADFAPVPGADASAMQAWLIAAVCRDDAGERLWPEGDLEQLKRRSAAVLDRVFSACQEVCGLGATRPT